MGCGISASRAHNDKAQTGASKRVVLSSHQKKLVLQTWKRLSSDMVGRGCRVFLYIFQLKPGLKAFFPFRDLDGEDLVCDLTFRGHATRFMQTVDETVRCVDDLEGGLAELLSALGKKHTHIADFRPEYWDTFVQSLDRVWEEDLGVKFTVECRQVWGTLFNYIIGKLREGYHSPNSVGHC